MDPLRIITETKGVFLTREALDLGYSDKAITAMVRYKQWFRVRRGAYAHYDVWSSATRVQQHLIRAAAIERSYGDAVAFSHVTAALIHGMDVWGVDLSRVHVTRLDGDSSRIENDIVHHRNFDTSALEVDRVDGHLVVPPFRAAIQTGLIAGTESALVTLDSALHLGLTTPDQLGTAFDSMQRWPNSRRLQIALRMADARSANAGESRTRWMFRCAGIPAPTLQYDVFDATGHLIGTTDFAWLTRRVLGEFDGRVKYGRFLRAGESPGDAVFREKVREDAIREATQCAMFRNIWSDLDTPVATCRRLDRLLRLAG